MDKELKACPFCGGEDIKYSTKTKGDGRYHAAMFCNSCHAYGKRTITKDFKRDGKRYVFRSDVQEDTEYVEIAGKEWNTRPLEQALQSKLDIAQKALEKLQSNNAWWEEDHTLTYDEWAEELAKEALNQIKGE